ncbi:hypothetical protein ACFVZC_32410 [Streptomyces marokkonensis]|uniref:Uncharacterized protein n=1 Tax=Streptomyces marokkonensis TaxID=324855 RepID=A0ABW6QFN6_9ACTN
MDGDHRADLVVTAPGSWGAPGSAWLLPGSDVGPLPQGLTWLHEDTFAGPGEAGELLLDRALPAGGTVGCRACRLSGNCNRTNGTACCPTCFRGSGGAPACGPSSARGRRLWCLLYGFASHPVPAPVTTGRWWCAPTRAAPR